MTVPKNALTSLSYLRTSQSLDRALGSLSHKVKEARLREMLLNPNLIELGLSSTLPNSSITTWILQSGPEQAKGFQDTLFAALVERLSMFLFSLSFTCDTPREVVAYRHYVQFAPAVLHVLSSTTLRDAPVREPTPPPLPARFSSFEGSGEGSGSQSYSDSESSINNSSSSEEDFAEQHRRESLRGHGRGRGRGRSGRGRGRGGVVGETPRARPIFEARIEVKSGQGSAKRSRAAPMVTIDTKPFQRLNVSVPQTRQEADALVSQIMEKLRDIMKFFIDTLRLPQIVEAIHAICFPSNTIVESAPPEEAIVEIRPEEPVVTVVPSAYPKVQPMKAALYFESADGFGEWRILISTRASKDLRAARKTDAKTFKIIIKKIKELSNGHFSDDNQKRLNNNITDVPIYEAKMTRDSRLVYQVDCQPEYGNDSNEYRQILRVFGIYTHAELDGRFWDSMSYQLARNGKEYKRRCNFREKPQNAGDKVFLPKIFNQPDAEDAEDVMGFKELPKAHLEEIHSLLVLEKFVTFSQALLNSLLADEDISHVFAVSPSEKEIIEHKASCYVLGRSGTGKTTTMLFKMLGLQRAWELSSHSSLPKPRQIFVTQSRVLATKVEEYFGKLLESLATGAKDIHELARLAKLKKEQKQGELVDVDDEVGWRSDLPARFSLLEEKHFPLFVTFDRLCVLLEADLRAKDSKPYAEVPQSPIQGLIRTGGLVSFDSFVTSYWPHFPQVLTKGLDPSLVFSEFMGIIKGSEEALGQPGHFLDETTYESLSHRGKSTFATQRTTVYSVFRAYLKLKRERGDYDVADRTHDILETLSDAGVPGQRIDYLYVDEAQDNLLIDALLLRSISSNPDGLFWAGDTAQTISVGSSFRFDDLKSFLFRVEKQRHETGTSVDNRISEPPKTFQLCANYRSHGGIVQCAHSVIELITHMWPHAIDSLQPEKGIVDGLKPVFFSGFNKDTVRYESFLFGNTGAHIEFGAQQCILVRNEEARAKLREEVGDIGVILTLYESKGLEFNDVLLYNFFEDSLVDLSKWRVVLNGLSASQKPSAPAPRFDDNKHAAICSELKFLYVAVTRARKNLWILDSSEKSEPMRELWSLLCMIEEHTPGSELPQLAVVSSPEEWANTGRELFQRKRWLQAMHCYQRAEMPKETAVSKAYLLREKARGTVSGPRKDDNKRALAFLEAAKAFVDCAEVASFETATYYRAAAECYLSAEEPQRAAKAYLLAEEYTLSAQLYRKCGMFDDAVAVIKGHKAKMVPDDVDSIVQHARLFYFKSEKLQQANDLFDSHEEALEYMEDYELDIARSSLLEAMGRFPEAAELHLLEGRTLDAIRLFLKATDDRHSMTRAKDSILGGLWAILGFGVPVTTARGNPDFEKLLKLASKLNRELLKPTDRGEVAMFQAIAEGNHAQLISIAKSFAGTVGMRPAELLCLDHIFVNPPWMGASSAAQISSSLIMFLVYLDLLRTVAFIANPGDNPTVCKVFGFGRSDESSIHVPPATFMHRILVDRNAYTPTEEGGFMIADHDFTRIFNVALTTRLSERAREQEALARNTPAFSPCLNHLISGQCNRSPCTREHVGITELNSEWYNCRVRLHLQQILVIQKGIKPQDGHRFRQYWLGRLHDALSPPTYLLGSPVNLEGRLIPEFQVGHHVFTDWCRAILNGIEPSSRTFLTNILQTLSMLNETTGSLLRAPCIAVDRPPLLMRQTGPGKAYIVHDLLDSMDGGRPWHLNHGVAFVRHVIEARVNIDINALCTFVDKLCGTYVLAARYRKDIIWNDVTLPRSWFLLICPKFKHQENLDCCIGLVRAIIAILPQLLERIYSGQDADHLSYENKPLSTAAYFIRNLFIARLCRVACLFGYNIRDFGLRNMIQQSLASLRRDPTRKFASIYQSYVTARGWDQLSRAVRQSTSRSSLDELVHLHHISKVSGPMPGIPGVRSVIHATKEITPAVLDPRASNLSATAAPFIPRPVTSTDGVDEDDDEAPVKDVGDVLPEGPAVDPDQLAREVALAREQQSSAATASVQEIHAATVLQVQYRKRNKRLHAVRKTGLPMHRQRQFGDYLGESKTMDWPYNHYRQLFLGPLPHILVCLVVAQDHCRKLKTEAKGRLKTASDAALEEVGKRMTELVDFNKKIEKLLKALGPKSSLHRDRDLVELKTRCVEVQTLLSRLPPGCSLDFSVDLALGLKGIVQEHVRKKEKKKPSLCMDSDGGESDESDM